jgi:hypothetical protein
MAGFSPRICNGVPIPYGESIENLRIQIATPGPEAWAAIRAVVARSDSASPRLGLRAGREIR